MNEVLEKRLMKMAVYNLDEYTNHLSRVTKRRRFKLNSKHYMRWYSEQRQSRGPLNITRMVERIKLNKVHAQFGFKGC